MFLAERFIQAFAAVFAIAEQRVTCVHKLCAYLVGAARYEAAFEQRQ